MNTWIHEHNQMTDCRIKQQCRCMQTHIWSEDLDPARFLLPSGVLKAESHPLLVGVPSLHLPPLKSYHLVLRRRQSKQWVSLGNKCCKLVHLLVLYFFFFSPHLQRAILSAGVQLEVMDADCCDDVTLPSGVAGAVGEHHLIVALTRSQQAQVLKDKYCTAHVSHY